MSRLSFKITNFKTSRPDCKKVKILSKSMLEQNNKGIECDDGSKQYPLIKEGTLEGFDCFQYKHMVKTGTNK
jgi:hypothetical protein